MKAKALKKKLKKSADPNTAKVLQGFFKTGPNQYGAGDIFIGVKIAPIRILAKEAIGAPLSEIKILLRSEIHEERMLALSILILQFTKANKVKDESTLLKIYSFYLRHKKYVNNWDLVDSSAPVIVGGYLSLQKGRDVLYKLAESQNLWDRRIAMVATLHFIRHNDFSDALALSEILKFDQEDLLHKAVGWMLREVGKKNRGRLINFLNCHSHDMPRTMLRYSIERLDKKQREFYMKQKMDKVKQKS